MKKIPANQGTGILGDLFYIKNHEAIDFATPGMQPTKTHNLYKSSH